MLWTYLHWYLTVSLDIYLTEVFYIKFEGLKVEFSCTWLKCVIALSYAMCTDFRRFGFLPSIRRSLSTVSSMPMWWSLSNGSHCLNSKTKTWTGLKQACRFETYSMKCISPYQVLFVSKNRTRKSFSSVSSCLRVPRSKTSVGGTGMGMPLWRIPSRGMLGSTTCWKALLV